MANIRKPYTEAAEHRPEPGKREPYTTSINPNGMPSIEDFLRGGRDLSGRIALAYGIQGPTHEAARLHDHLRLLEDVIYEHLLLTVGDGFAFETTLRGK